MQPVIYADVLIFLNTVITFILLLSSAELSGMTATPGRLVTGAVVGGIYSLIILAPPLNVMLMIITRLSMCVSIVCITFNVHKFRKLIRCTVSFGGISFLFAGVLYFIEYTFNPEFVQINNGYAYCGLNIFTLLISCTASYFIIRFIRKKYFPIIRNDIIYDIDITLNGKTAHMKALLDTGNSLCDIYTGKPVIIVNIDAAREIMDSEMNRSLEDNFSSDYTGGEMSASFRLIPVKTLEHSRLLPAFTADYAQISDDNTTKKITSPCIVLTEDNLGDKEYKALLNESII